MAAFIAKQMIGNKLDSVKDMGGEKKEGEGEGDAAAAEDPEVIEARLEQEKKRRDKYAKMEDDREKVRQGIRDKYKIKKQEEVAPILPDLDGSLNRQKKDPASLSINPDEDDFDPMKMATNLFTNIKTSISNIPFPWK